MRRRLILPTAILAAACFATAENTVLYTGRGSNKAQFIGISQAGDVLDFLQLQFDIMKYVKDDPSLHNEDKLLSRGDFLGVSLNVALKLPIHLIPGLDRFDFIQPYLVVGKGIGAESLSPDYYEFGAGQGGLFKQLRTFGSFGYGLVVMFAPSIGARLDVRSVNIAESEGMGVNGAPRKFQRVSVGLCFGAYKKAPQRLSPGSEK